MVDRTDSSGLQSDGAAENRVPRLLTLALTVSGASRVLLIGQDGAVLAAAGDPLPSVSDAELARAALAGAGKLKGAGLFAVAEMSSSMGARLGMLVAAAPKSVKPPPRLDQTLRQLAGLCAAALDVQPVPEGLAESERTALVAEVDHRVRNVLAAVQSMASQSARRAGSLDGFLKAFSGRLKAMASAHELLTATRGRGWR